MKQRLTQVILLLFTLALWGPWAAAAGETLAIYPGQTARDLDGQRGADGRFTVFYAGTGNAADDGRIAWIYGVSGSEAGCSGAGLLPRGWSKDAIAYGPAGLLLPGEKRPSVAWIERQGGGCRIFFARGVGSWSSPEPVFPHPVDLVRFLDGAGNWLAWVESRTYNDNIVACRRGAGGWEQPVAVSLSDSSEDLSPAVALHPSGDPWVVWAGANDGGRDEIFLSLMREGEWIRELQVSREDKTPDVLPDLAISPGGQACVSWLGYDQETRTYRVTASFSTDGRAWTSEVRLGQGSFSRPPRLALLADGRFLLVWCDPAGALWYAEQNGESWSTARKVLHPGNDSASSDKMPLLLIHRSDESDGSLRAVPRRLP